MRRTIFHFPEAEQINVFDERYYKKPDEEVYYPSVTQVLNIYPKGVWFAQWLKEVGLNADAIRDKAAESGSKVHNAIEKFLCGEEISYFRKIRITDENGISKEVEEIVYSLEEWQMICKFMEFYDQYVVRVIAVEQKMISDKLRTGGTIDMVAELRDGFIWDIDFKTSNSVQKTHEIQQAVYSEMWNEQPDNDVKIQRAGILWLKAKTRGPARSGDKIQGKGWQVKEIEDIGHCMKLWEHTRALYDEENPNDVPKNLEYPDKFKLNQTSE